MAALAALAVAAPAAAQSCGTPEPGSITTLCATSAGTTFAVVASFSWGEITLLVLVVLLLVVTLLRLGLEAWFAWKR